MKSSLLSVAALVLVAGAMFFYHTRTASAGVSISVVQGSPVTLHYGMTGGVQDCNGDTNYPRNLADGVYAAWVIPHYADANGNGAVSFPSVTAPAGSYNFSCTNLATGVTDSATLTVVAPCGAGTVWNGAACVPSAPAAGTPGQGGTPSAACTLPWGGVIQSGESVTAYQTSSVASPATCQPPTAETRTCLSGVLSGSYQYQTCTVQGGPATASISASPTRVRSGSSSTVTWSASGVTSCTVSGPGLSSTSKQGSQSATITQQSLYTLTCQTSGAPVSETA